MEVPLVLPMTEVTSSIIGYWRYLKLENGQYTLKKKKVLWFGCDLLCASEASSSRVRYEGIGPGKGEPLLKGTEPYPKDRLGSSPVTPLEFLQEDCCKSLSLAPSSGLSSFWSGMWSFLPHASCYLPWDPGNSLLLGPSATNTLSNTPHSIVKLDNQLCGDSDEKLKFINQTTEIRKVKKKVPIKYEELLNIFYSVLIYTTYIINIYKVSMQL